MLYLPCRNTLLIAISFFVLVWQLCGKVAKTGTTMKRRILWALGIAVCEACNKKWSVKPSHLDLSRSRCSLARLFDSLMNRSDLGPSFPFELLLIMPCTDHVFRDREWMSAAVPEAHLTNMHRIQTAFSKENGI